MKRLGEHFFGDKDVQVILGTLLRVGVIISMTVVFIGGVFYMMSYKSNIIDYSVFNPSGHDFSSMTSIFAGLGTFNSKAIIQFGVILLIFTPISRVVFSIFTFLIERDYMYVLIGLFVLCVILFSLSNKLAG